LFPEERRIELHVTLDWSKQRTTFDWFLYHTDKNWLCSQKLPVSPAAIF